MGLPLPPLPPLSLFFFFPRDSINPKTALPDIEPSPTDAQLSAVTKLITSELDPSHSSTPHPMLPALRDPSFTPLFAKELDRVSRSEPLAGGVDLSRYDPPTNPSPDSLHAAYTSNAYLADRITNLSLLSEYGKNAWLIHNADLERVLKALEEDLMAVRTETEVVNKARKAAQVGVETELKRLEERWKKGVGRVLEVEVAAEMVRREVLQKQRQGGGA